MANLQVCYAVLRAPLLSHRTAIGKNARSDAQALALGPLTCEIRAIRIGIRRAAWIASAVAVIGGGAAALWISRVEPVPSAPALAPQTAPSELPASSKDDDISTEALYLSDGGDDYRLLDPDSVRELGVDGVVTSLSDLNIPVTKRTMRYVAQFGADEKGRKSFISRFSRGNRFRAFIERELLEAGMPQDLVWVAAIESGFRPQAASPKGAMGLFQFMPETGAQYGLLLSNTVDERRSIPKATRAAIAHLETLYEHYGAWDLTLAAYNCGQGRVDAALEKAAQIIGEREDPILFHDLAERKLLPRETLDYVPMIQAFAIVAHNRAQLELDSLTLPEPMSFGEVAVPLGTPLATVALAADISISDLREYNPDLLSDTTGDGEGDTIVLVPAERLSRVAAALPSLLYGAGAKKSANEEDAEEEAEADAEPEPTPSESESQPTVLHALANRPGAFLLSSGVVVVLVNEPGSQVKVSASVALRDWSKPEKTPLSTHVIEERAVPLKKLSLELKKLQRDLVTQARSVSAPKLYASVQAARRKRYDAAELLPFELLSNKVFRLGHPLHGSLLVGPTRNQADRIVSVEPFWAVETTVTLKGNVSAEKHAELLEEVFVDPMAPRRLPRLPEAAHVRLAPVGKDLLLGWGAHPFAPGEDVAADLAFALACNDRFGRLPSLVVRDRKVAKSLSCGLEKSPGTIVAWVRAAPQGDEPATTLERSVLEALVGITGLGPNEDEVDTARDYLRADWARRVSAAKSEPERRVLERDQERTLSQLDDISRDAVLNASRKLFSTKRRVLITWDGTQKLPEKPLSD